MSGPLPANRLPVDEAGRLAWLRLVRTPRIGPVSFLELMRVYPSAQAALDALPDLARKGGAKRPAQAASREAAEREMVAAEAAGAQMLMLGAAAYPRNLAAIDAPPPLLWSLGAPETASEAAVALVGARNASALGLKFTETLARDLGRAGHAVISGLARGVDAAAHRGALEGGTVAVLAGGVDNLWPPQNAELYAAIRERGAILSERPMGYEARAQDFPRRNRLVSGLAQGIVVTEGAERSGSLITARYAGEQGREVMAVPGSPLDPRCGGCNALIREGATLVRGVEDVLEALTRQRAGPLFGEPSDEDWHREAVEPDDTMRTEIAALLSLHPVHIDELARLSGASPGALALVLLELDLAGRLRREPGGMVALAPHDLGGH